MKNYKNILFALALIPFLSGCFDEPGTEKLITSKTDGFVEIVEASTNVNSKNIVVVPDGNNESTSITLSFGGAVNTSGITATVEVVAESTTAIAGVDYVLGETTVTIPAGEYTAGFEFQVVDDILDPEATPKRITFRIATASVSILAPYEEVSISLIGLCPSNLYDYTTVAGVYGTSAVGTSTDSCTGPDPFTTESSETLTRDESKDTENELAFTISDSFANLYSVWYFDCYGSSGNTSQSGTIWINTSTGAIRGVGIEVYETEWTIEGNFNACNGSIQYRVRNGFGDVGNVTFTKPQN